MSSSKSGFAEAQVKGCWNTSGWLLRRYLLLKHQAGERVDDASLISDAMQHLDLVEKQFRLPRDSIHTTSKDLSGYCLVADGMDVSGEIVLRIATPPMETSLVTCLGYPCD